MIIFIKVSKQGDADSYINKPVLNKAIGYNKGTLFSNPVAVGTVTEVIIHEDYYELKLTIFDKFVKEVREYIVNELGSISISFWNADEIIISSWKGEI